MITVLEPTRREPHTVYLEGPLNRPHTPELDRRLRALVRRGERRIVLDLSRVPSIDAGGIGALMRAYRRMCAVDGALRIVNANPWVRKVLKLVGVFSLLTDEE